MDNTINNFNTINRENIDRAIEILTKDRAIGTVYHAIGSTSEGELLYIIYGWEEGYEEDSSHYQRRDSDDKLYTLCMKLAFNVSALQCDYDVDWYLPSDDEGNVWDTEMAIDKTNYAIEWYNKEARDILDSINKGTLIVPR